MTDSPTDRSTSGTVVILTSSSTFALTKPEIILCRFLRDRGLTPIVFAPREGTLPTALRDSGVEVHIIPGVERWRTVAVRLWVPLIMRRILSTVGQRRVVLVHAGRLSVTPFAVRLARHWGVPSLCHLHGVPPDGAKFRRYCAHKADAVVAVSSKALHAYERPTSQPVLVIRNGMDVSAFRILAGEFDARERLGLGTAPVVGMSGVSARKGTDLFVEAAGVIAERRPETRFVIMGGPGSSTFEAALQARMAACGISDRVVRGGYQSNIAPFIAAADVWLTPSRDDAAPMVVMEAMTLGKALVGTRVGGIPELVSEGESGLLVPSDDPAALAAATCSLLESNETRTAFGRAGERLADERFSHAAYCRAMGGVYQGLLSGTR